MQTVHAGIVSVVHRYLQRDTNRTVVSQHRVRATHTALGGLPPSHSGLSTAQRTGLPWSLAVVIGEPALGLCRRVATGEPSYIRITVDARPEAAKKAKDTLERSNLVAGADRFTPSLRHHPQMPTGRDQSDLEPSPYAGSDGCQD